MAPLGLRSQRLALDVIDVVGAGAGHGAAVVAFQQALFAKLVDVAADGLGRHFELAGQPVDRDEALPAGEVEDLLLAGVALHGADAAGVMPQPRSTKEITSSVASSHAVSSRLSTLMTARIWTAKSA